MAEPRTTTITTSSAAQWSNASNFDGYLLLGIGPPSNADGVWTTVSIGSTFPAVRLPIWTKIPIKDGVINANTLVFYNADLEPPNCRYVAYWYDSNNRRISPVTGVDPTFFDVSTSPHTITVPTLTVPTAPTSTVPTPV